MSRIALVDKCPSKNDYSKYFDFDIELFHLCNVPITKLLKRDVYLEIDLDYYDYIILVGSEAAKEYAKVTSVTNMAGQLVKDKFICISNPAMLIFKPEGKDDFLRSVDKVKKYIKGEIANMAVSGDFKGIDNEEEATAFLLEILNSQAPVVAIDTEGTALYPRDGYVIGMSLSYKKYHGRYILVDALSDYNVSLIQDIINRYPIVFHNMKYDLKMIEYHFNLKFDRGRVHDTMLLHYVLDENSPHGLKPLSIKYTRYGDYDTPLEEFKKKYCKDHGILEEDFTYDLIPYDIMALYASIDPAATLELFETFLPLVEKNEKLKWVYYNLLIKGTLFLHEMEEVGIPISKERMIAAEKFLDFNITEAKEKVYEFPEVHDFEAREGIIFNPNSVPQLRKLLFDYLKLTPTGKLTKTGAISTDAEVLEELALEHPLPKAILNVRQLGKIKNTYISKILPELDRDGRIRTNFNLIFTTSGRLSSSGKFNAQQIPRDNPIIKGCIVAPEGYTIISQDLQTGEMYFAAVLSGDKNLQSVFTTGEDFHSSIAKMVFNLDCIAKLVKEIYPAMRQSAKAISFGILYGSGADKVASTVSEATGEYYGKDTAQDDIDAYFTKFSKLKKWLKSREAFIKENGFTYSFFGRKRRLINVFSADKGIAAHEVRSGINSEVQSICSDVNLLGAIESQEEFDRLKLDAKIFMLVHDSIVVLVRDDLVEQACEILAKYTQRDRGCSIPGCPIGIDQEIGKDYSFGKFDKTYKLIGDTLSRI